MDPKGGNQIIVDGIFAKGDNNVYECVAKINNYSNLCQRIAVGESIHTNDFALIFPNSIGESIWRLLLYPKGQYVGGQAGTGIGIYLVMQSCEQVDKTLNAIVTFQLRSDVEDVKGPIKYSRKTFDYTVPSKRWTGEPEFFGKKWLNEKRRQQFCINDCLVIHCTVEETRSEKKQPPVVRMENGFVVEDYKAEENQYGKKESEWMVAGPRKGKKMQQQLQNNNDAGTSKPKSSVNNRRSETGKAGTKHENKFEKVSNFLMACLKR